MALTLTKEDGTGLANANAYASVAEGDTYHAGHVNAGTWTAATTAQKEAALVMATRLIDASYQFNGWRKSDTQALQWPRVCAVDPDKASLRLSVLINSLGVYFASDQVPRALVDATCEQARALLEADRTSDPTGEGLKQMTIVGSMSLTFDAQDRMPMLTRLVQTMLAKLGTLLQTKQGSVKLVRT